MSGWTEEGRKGAEEALALGERRGLLWGLQPWTQVRDEELREVVSAWGRSEPVGERACAPTCD